VLFTLLDAMDGAAADADLLFLPDADAHRRLVEVYSRTLPLLMDETEIDEVTGAHVSCALDDLLASGQSVTRALLGVQDGSEIPPVGTGRSSEGHRGIGWLRGSAGYGSAVCPHTDGT
jgi:hypothetical protein